LYIFDGIDQFIWDTTDLVIKKKYCRVRPGNLDALTNNRVADSSFVSDDPFVSVKQQDRQSSQLEVGGVFASRGA
jgi:hypothetical protein